jgi:hypothetical protein
MTGRLPVTGRGASSYPSVTGIRSGASCARLLSRLAALVDPDGPGFGASRRALRRRHPRRQTEITGELATWPILPILQTMLALAASQATHYAAARVFACGGTTTLVKYSQSGHSNATRPG